MDNGCHRRNHQTTMKNQKTTMRKTMYHSQRQPCRTAMLFMRRKVPARMPDVSEKASFCVINTCIRGLAVGVMTRDTYHLTKLHSRLADLVTNAYGDLYVCPGRIDNSSRTEQHELLTSLSNLTLAVNPSRCSSFWLSRSSAYR